MRAILRSIIRDILEEWDYGPTAKINALAARLFKRLSPKEAPSFLEMVWVDVVIIGYTCERIAELCQEYIRNVHVCPWSRATAVNGWSTIWDERYEAFECPERFVKPYLTGSDPVRLICDHIAWVIMDQIRELNPTFVTIDPRAPWTFSRLRGHTITFRIHFAYR